ncbi:MAG: hypothetical protein QOC85_1030 [Streptomyces sp.]|nr:hypothetical protein [Pseudonocardiales bacterium]MDX6362027.1 hypothetical protein [Streptomyces sp.]
MSEHRSHRCYTAHVTGGIDGVLRVAMIIRNRGYRLRDFSVDVHEGVLETPVRLTAMVTPDEGRLLLARLRRLPAVVSADPA